MGFWMLNRLMTGFVLNQCSLDTSTSNVLVSEHVTTTILENREALFCLFQTLARDPRTGRDGITTTICPQGSL